MKVNKIINRVVKKRRCVIVEEKNLKDILSVLDKNTNSWNKNRSLGNCGWADRDKWFIRFDASNDTWNGIHHDLIREGFTSIRDSMNRTYIGL